MTSDTPRSVHPLDAEDASLLPLVTFVLWTLALTIGLLGFIFPYHQTPAPPPSAPSIQTHIVNVEIPKNQTSPPVPLKISAPQIALPSPQLPSPPAPQQIKLPDAPPIAVAVASPALSFPLPIEGMTKLVDADQVAHSRPTLTAISSNNIATTQVNPSAAKTASAISTPPVTHLTFGEGEGNQPPPEYPRDAQLAGQEGSITIRFTVDETGRVTSLAVTTPSHWPLLNQAATRAIRNTWHFTPGPVRNYDVTIEFQLQK